MKSNIFLIQAGYRGKNYVKEAVNKTFSDGAILRPMNKKDENIDIVNFLLEKKKIKLFDSQLYFPENNLTNAKMLEYSYFKNNFAKNYTQDSFEQKTFREKVCKEIIEFQDYIKTDAYLSPSKFIHVYSETDLKSYLELSRIFIDQIKEKNTEKPCLVSLPIASGVISDEQNRTSLLNYLTGLDCEGFYILFSSDIGEGYPLANTTDIINLMQLIYTLKKNKYYVLVGYSHHISYLLSCSGVDGYAIGYYKNLRCFDPKSQRKIKSKSRRPAINYFSTAILNDLRAETDVKMLMSKDSKFNINTIKSNSPYESSLFHKTDLPSVWGEKDSYNHYLWCCHNLLQKQKDKTAKEKILNVETQIQNSRKTNELIKKSGLPKKDFDKLYDSWWTALQEFKKTIDEEVTS